jgi:hypothetical protein
MRVFEVTLGGVVSKKRSMSIVLPLPTSPYMYRPFGRSDGMSLIGFLTFLLLKRELNTDLGGG